MFCGKFWVLACCLLGINLFAGDTLLLMNARIADGVQPVVSDPVQLLIMDGRIMRITKNNLDIVPGTKIMDMGGRFLMPGLVDAHVHIANFADAKRALWSGVTTARTMGVAHFADLGLRELARAGKIDAPEILAAGYHVRPEPDEAFYMNFPELADLMNTGIRGEAAMRRMAQALMQKDIDWIKVNATARAGLPQTDPREPYYSTSEMQALVETGALRGIKVAAHAHGDEGGRAAVAAGVASIEHGTYLTETTLKMMAERGTYLVPTIAVVSDLVQPGGDYQNPVLEIRGRQMLPRVREMTRLAHTLGVKIVAATDTHYGAEGTLRMGQEITELVGCGLSPFEAIRAATSLSAELLGVHQRTGMVKEGFEADLLVVDRNPYEDAGAVNDPLLIINNGKIVLNRLIWQAKP